MLLAPRLSAAGFPEGYDKLRCDWLQPVDIRVGYGMSELSAASHGALKGNVRGRFAAFDSLDVVVNDAGYRYAEDVEEVTEDEVLDQLATTAPNCPRSCSRVVLPPEPTTSALLASDLDSFPPKALLDYR